MTLIAQKANNSEAIGHDLLQNSVHRLAGYDRVVNRAGVALFKPTGGAIPTTAAGTLYVELFASDVLIGQFYAVSAAQGTSSAGNEIVQQVPAVTGDLNMFTVMEDLPAGSELRAILQGAALNANDALILYIELDPVDDEDEAGAVLSAMMGV